MIAALMGLPGKVKTLVDRLTSTRAGNLDNLDAAISTRAAASTALSTSQWTNTRAGYLDNLASIPTTPINRIQHGTIFLDGLDTSKTATITSVSTSKSLILHLGVNCASDSVTDGSVRVTLTNATTITATRGTASAAATVGYCVVEFK